MSEIDNKHDEKEIEEKGSEIENVNIDNENTSKKKEKVKSYLKDFLVLAILVILVFLVKKYIVTPVQVNGDSMMSTLIDGDIMILDKVSYKLKGLERFDIVVVEKDDSLLIKRVIGLPKEHLKVHDNTLYIDDKIVSQDFLSDDELTEDFETDVGDDCYFLMGDNRDNSLDSRELECFDIDKIEGTATFVFYPFSRFGNKN